MKQLTKAILINFVSSAIIIASANSIDVTFLGPYIFADGMGRRSISQIETLKDDISIGFINTRREPGKDADIQPSVLKILHNKHAKPGTVMVFLDHLFDELNKPLYDEKAPYKIKFAYVTVESTKAPESWIKILNTYFDGVLVPDPWSSDSLKNSGLRLPTFVLPEICYLEEFLEEPLQQQPHNPFTFGVSATAWNYKNYDLLLEAFAAEFKNKSDVRLKVHNHFEGKKASIENKIKALNLKNIEVTHGPISKKAYKEHMKSIDCYALFSKGEGFSLTPREAIALGRPCILGNHTAHKTICATEYVKCVDPTIVEKHDSQNYRGTDIGNVFNCELGEARKALRDVYQHYPLYLNKGAQGREWVKRYLGKNLKKYYLAVLKPKKIVLGTSNQAKDDYLETNSQALYNKYVQYIGGIEKL